MSQDVIRPRYRRSWQYGMCTVLGVWMHKDVCADGSQFQVLRPLRPQSILCSCCKCSIALLCCLGAPLATVAACLALYLSIGLCAGAPGSVHARLPGFLSACGHGLVFIYSTDANIDVLLRFVIWLAMFLHPAGNFLSWALVNVPLQCLVFLYLLL